MVDIVPREAYSVDENGMWRRAAWLSGAFYGILLWILSRARLAALAGGVLYGVLFVRFLRWGMERMLDKFFRADASGSYSHRMPCSLSKDGGFTVGGTLYFGPGGFVFVPHRMNLPRDRASVPIGPPEKLRFSTAPGVPPFTIMRLLFERVPELIVIGVEDGPELRLLAPRPKETRAALETLARAAA